MGAYLHGGRWNDRGQYAVYLAEHISLAQLEILVNLKDSDTLAQYHLFSLEVPDRSVVFLDDRAYPRNWQARPAASSTRKVGGDFLKDQSRLCLGVRSCVVPQEYLVLLNPSHPDASSVISTARKIPMPFDPRLFS